MHEEQTSLITEQRTEKPFLDLFLEDITEQIEETQQSSTNISAKINDIQLKIQASFSKINPERVLKDHDINQLVLSITKAQTKIKILEEQAANNAGKLQKLLDTITSVKINSDITFSSGSYAGRKVSDVPASYLVYIYDNHYSRGDIDRYIQSNYHLIKQQALKEKR